MVRHGGFSGSRVVLGHGNGFASDSYFPFWQPMLERFDLALFGYSESSVCEHHGIGINLLSLCLLGISGPT